MTIREVGIGMVGAGFLAETRARCYAQARSGQARGRIVAVTSRTGERARTYADRHGVSTVDEDLDQLLGRDEVEAVDLCVPNDMHRPLAVRAAQAGKHVICTKPLTAYVGQGLGPEASPQDVARTDRKEMLRIATEDARAMVDAAAEAGVQLCYGENWIYAPALVRAADLMRRAGSVVLEIRGGEAHNGSHSPYAKQWCHTGGGALLRLGAHPVGAMLYLKRVEGEARGTGPIRPVAVSAEVTDLTANPHLRPENTQIVTGWEDVENWGTCIITFDDGSRGVAWGGDHVLGGMESRLEIFGSNFQLKLNMSPNDLLQAYAPDSDVLGDEYLIEKQSTTAGWSQPMPDEPWTSGQLGMIEAFVDDLAVGRRPQSDGQLGLDVTRVIYSAYVAAAEGRRVEL